MYRNKVLDTAPFKSKRNSVITNKYQSIGSIMSRNTFYARPTDSSLSNSTGNPFFVKANFGDVPADRRAAFIPTNADPSKPETGLILPSGKVFVGGSQGATVGKPSRANKYERWMYTGSDIPLSTFPLVNPRNVMNRGLFSWLFGGFESPTTQSTTVTFNTNVKDNQRFANEVQSFNQNIADFVLSLSQEQVSDLSQLAEFNILGLSTSSDLNIEIKNTQAINFMNLSKMDVKSVNEYVLNQSNAIVDQVLNNFQAANSTDLLLRNSSATNSNLLSSILALNPPKGVNMNTIITNNTQVETQFVYEKKAIYTNISKNTNINQFAQKLQSVITNVFKVNLQNINVAGKANIVIYNDQNIKSIVDIVTSLDLLTSVFKTVDASNTFKVDRNVSNIVQSVTKSAQENVNKQEGFSDVITSAGDATKNVLSSIGLNTFLVPALLGGGAIVLLYFMMTNSGGSSGSSGSSGSNNSVDNNFQNSEPPQDSYSQPGYQPTWSSSNS